eukprot:534870_1
MTTNYSPVVIDKSKTTNYSPVIIDKSKQRKKYLVCGVVIAILVVGILVTVICALIVDAGNGMKEDEAAGIFENLNNVNISDIQANITYENLFEASFHIFDKNDDGYLDSDEFAHYYEIKLGRSKIFEIIDVDNDDILSYPECVAFVKEMFKLEIVFERYLIHAVAPLVSSLYTYKYNQTNNKLEDQLFIEYLTMVLFFEPYDIDKNGYIRHDEFILISSQTSFSIGDADSDNKINETELFELFYGTDAEHSWKGINKQLVGDSVSVNDVVVAIHNIEMNMEMVQNVKENIQLCPSQLYAVDDELVGRRLQEKEDEKKVIIIIIII